MALNVVMLGPPGAGKGTQAERFARTHGLPKISTGDILREAVAGGHAARAARPRRRWTRGELVGDDVMIAIVGERLARPDATRGFVLDGFPRTVRAGRGARRDDGRRAAPLVVVDIVVPEDVLVRRLAARRICGTCGIERAGRVRRRRAASAAARWCSAPTTATASCASG